MFTNDNLHGNIKIKFEVRLGSWFELDWAGRPNHSMTARHVVLAERKLTTYVYAVGGLLQSWYQSRVPAFRFHSLPASATVITMDEDRDAALMFYGMQPLLFDGTRRTVSLTGWLYDMESIFRICHIESRLHVLLATRCLAVDARIWLITIGEPAMLGGTWADFRALITTCYGPLPDEDASMPYRDPEFCNDMYLGRYLSYVVDWRAYPNKSMGHYCRLFRDAIWPHIPRDLGSSLLQALLLLLEGLPPNVLPFVPEPMVVPVDDAGIAEPLFHGGPNLPEDPIPVMPLQEEEAGAENDVMDPADFPVDPEDNPKDSPIIVIKSDDEEEDEEDQEQWEEQEGAIEEDLDDLEELEEDSEEILFDNGDWDADSDISSDITTAWTI
ncbi:hypothetical protein TIFTF001_035164 [Ficus carica]|uniref:Uncharacterized protein n=1 Tax=Ficus carica TaxID=3494 RepID=A0AA88J9V9_FICCA|nr:hypothetical protein TIFTF001_035164 [Ficus carica]